MKRASLCYLTVCVATLLHATVPMAMAAGDAANGDTLFKRYCAGCHGPDGKGGGKGFMPHVGPLAKKGYIDTVPDEYLATVISEGGEATGKSAFMPAWKGTLSPEQIADLVAYIRTFTVE